jgi:predicted enzyme related to lactoylglutathione lyase
MANHHGDFVWYELITPDVDAAQAFYAPLLGWTVRDAGVPGIDYRLAATAECDVAGIMRMPAGAPMSPAWLGYVGVEDVDAMAEAFRAEGGTVHLPPTDVSGVGRFALVSDPQGALLYVIRTIPPDARPDAESLPFSYDRPRPGHCAWNELVTSDPSAALHFYGRRFGWIHGGEIDMGELGAYQFLRHAGRAPEGSPPMQGILGAVMRCPPGTPRSAWTYYFRVPDIDAAVAHVGAHGGTVTVPPMEIPGGEFSMNAVDPQGTPFALVGPRKARAT